MLCTGGGKKVLCYYRVGQGEVGGCIPLGDSAWRLLQLAVEKPWPTATMALNPSFHPSFSPNGSCYHVTGEEGTELQWLSRCVPRVLSVCTPATLAWVNT